MIENKKGFTMIELLAVIVIMGILMATAIPIFSNVINNSRKDTFIETVAAYNDTVKTMWDGNMLYCGSAKITPEYLGNGTYYVLIDSNNKDLVSNGGNSSWHNKQLKGYVKITVQNSFSSNRTENYSIALTDGIHGLSETTIKNGILKADKKDIMMDLNDPVNIDTLNSINKEPFTTGKVTTCVISGIGSDGPGMDIVYPDNIFEYEKDPANNKNQFEIGDTLKIGGEEFYVLKNTSYNNDDSKYVTAIAKYNLSLYSGVKQDPYTSDKIAFSNTNYWTYTTGNIYIYKENNEYSEIDDYLQVYKDYLAGYGVVLPAKDPEGMPGIRLMTYFEHGRLGNSHKVFNTSRDWWLGSSPSRQQVWATFDLSVLQVYNHTLPRALRPVITVPKQSIRIV